MFNIANNSKAKIVKPTGKYCIYEKNNSGNISEYEPVLFINDRVEAKKTFEDMNAENKYYMSTVSHYDARNYFVRVDFTTFKENAEYNYWEMDAEVVVKKLGRGIYGAVGYQYQHHHPEPLNTDTADTYGDCAWLEVETGTFGFNSGVFEEFDGDIQEEEFENWLRESFKSDTVYAIKGLIRKTMER